MEQLDHVLTVRVVHITKGGLCGEEKVGEREKEERGEGEGWGGGVMSERERERGEGGIEIMIDMMTKVN